MHNFRVRTLLPDAEAKDTHEKVNLPLEKIDTHRDGRICLDECVDESVKILVPQIRPNDGHFLRVFYEEDCGHRLMRVRRPKQCSGRWVHWDGLKWKQQERVVNMGLVLNFLIQEDGNR